MTASCSQAFVVNGREVGMVTEEGSEEVRVCSAVEDGSEVADTKDFKGEVLVGAAFTT